MSSAQTDVHLTDAVPAQVCERTLGLKAGLLLVVFALIVLLPGIHVSFTDRDEGNYAQVCRTMFETGEWLVPRHHGQPWLDKPPLLYWLVTASFHVFGMGEWQARLVSVLASAASALLTGMLGAWMFGRRVGLIAGLLLATCGMFAVVGRMFLMDPILLTCILAAIALHWRIAEQSRDREGAGEGPGSRVQVGERERGGEGGTEREQPTRQSAIRNPQSAIHCLAAAYWFIIGLGVLAKGPTIAVFAGGFALALTRLPGSLKRLGGWRWWAWMPLAVLVAAPWFIAMSRQSGSVMKDQFLLFGIISRVIGNPDGHGGPPGYHLAHSLATLLPWIVFVPTAILATIRERPSDPQLRLMLVWLIVPWIVVEVMRAKLPHYVLPCYVPLMILIARQWDAAITAGRWPSATWAERWVPPVWPGVMIVLGAAMMVGGEVYATTLWGRPVIGLGVVMAAGFAAAGGLLRRGRITPAFVTGLATSATLFITAGCWLAPAMEPLRLSRNLAGAINETARPGDEVLLCGYEEPSTFYYIRPVARPANVADVGLRLVLPEGPFVLAAAGERESGPALPPLNKGGQGGVEGGGDARPPAPSSAPSHSRSPAGRRVRGFNYVKSEWVTVWVERHAGREGEEQR